MPLSVLRLTCLWIALEIMVLMAWGQQTHPPITPFIPPPPTMNDVVNMSVVVFAGEPVITTQLIRVTIDCGQLIDEIVNTTGITNPNLTWFKDGAAIPDNRSAINVMISADQRFCVITDTLLAVGGQLGTDGNYSCEVCSTPTNCLRNDTYVEVCGEPHIMEPISPARVTPFFMVLTCGQDIEVPDLTGTETILINCAPFNGSNPLTMQVYKDGELIPGAGFPYTIVRADRETFGTYAFVLSTEKCGSDVAVSRILHQGNPPDIDEGPFIPQPATVPPGDMEVRIGSPAYVIDGANITLVCDILTGTSPITIMWFHNGVLDPTRGNVSTITVTDYDDGDVYTCRADNDVGFDEEITTINVFEPPQILPIPIPTAPPGEISVTTGIPSVTPVDSGTPVTIYCPSSGTDYPTIVWAKDGTPITSGGRFTISTTQLGTEPVTSVLEIDDFQPGDVGTYTCTSTNRAGEDTGSTELTQRIELPVIDGGQCVPQPQVIPNGDVTLMIGSPAYINDGYDLTLTCKAVHGIPITISWYRDGVLDSSRGNTSTITIENVDIDKDNGAVYTCRAGNDNGYDEQHTIVDVFTPLCSHEICRTRKNNILCIIPDSTCLCKRQMGYCSAAYYSTDTRPIPATCTQCSNPTDLSCLKSWSSCVKRSDEAAHGRPNRRMRTAANFKIYTHSC